MAPEVALSESYNLIADVYSFGLLLWQIFSLDLPFGSDRPKLRNLRHQVHQDFHNPSTHRNNHCGVHC
jgi:hypothetical protein